LSRRNVDFDEREAAILEHVFEETKRRERINASFLKYKSH
jgi:hypothetical protein